MASDKSTVAATGPLFEEGFLDLNDSAIGGRVWDTEQKGFPSGYGLAFFKDHIVDDPRVQSILLSFFEGRCILGHWLRYKADPAFECFIRGGEKAGRCALAIHLLPKGSRLDYFGGSHLLDLPTNKSERSTYETKEAALRESGLKLKTKTFDDGGIVIRDARLRIRITEGYAITFVFATEGLVAGWPKIVVPSSNALVQRVRSMENRNIGVNFAFEDRHADTDA